MCSRNLMPVGFLLIVLMLSACADKTSETPSTALTPPAAAPLPVANAPDKAPPGGKVGKASIYSDSLQGKPMADGKPYDPNAPIAASKTLPLGTIAKVTNLENGKSTVVKVEDRGPMVKGRTVDLARAAAHKLGLTEKQGVAPVEVKPIGRRSTADIYAGE